MENVLHALCYVEPTGHLLLNFLQKWTDIYKTQIIGVQHHTSQGQPFIPENAHLAQLNLFLYMDVYHTCNY